MKEEKAQSGEEDGSEKEANNQDDDERLNWEKLKEQEASCNALVNGMLPYEIELLEQGHESYEKIRNDLIQLIDAQD